MTKTGIEFKVNMKIMIKVILLYCVTLVIKRLTIESQR